MGSKSFSASEDVIGDLWDYASAQYKRRICPKKTHILFFSHLKFFSLPPQLTTTVSKTPAQDPFFFFHLTSTNLIARFIHYMLNYTQNSKPMHERVFLMRNAVLASFIYISVMLKTDPFFAYYLPKNNTGQDILLRFN